METLIIRNCCTPEYYYKRLWAMSTLLVAYRMNFVHVSTNFSTWSDIEAKWTVTCPNSQPSDMSPSSPFPCRFFLFTCHPFFPVHPPHSPFVISSHSFINASQTRFVGPLSLLLCPRCTDSVFNTRNRPKTRIDRPRCRESPPGCRQENLCRQLPGLQVAFFLLMSSFRNLYRVFAEDHSLLVMTIYPQ